MFTIYGAALMIENPDLYITEGEYTQVSNFGYLKQIYMSLLPIYAFYHFSIKGLLSQKLIRIMTFMLLAVTIANYMYYSSLFALTSTREGVTLNVGYSFLELLPLILLLDIKPSFQFLVFILCLVFIVLCVKRGAIIIGAFCYILFILSKIKSGRNVRVYIFLSLISLIFIYYYLEYTMANNAYFQHRIEQTIDGNSSNRDQIYSTFWNHFISEQNIFKFMFGNGANSTLTIGINYAHNDWLEIAINNGLFGLLMYFCYFVFLLKDALKIRAQSSLMSSSMVMAFVILLMTSFFSMSYASIGLPLAIVIGYVLGQRRMQNPI